MPLDVNPDRLRRCYAQARDLLLAERTPGHYWVGELSTSALSTATAVMALWQVRRGAKGQERGEAKTGPGREVGSLIFRGLRWLVDHQNPDGGWGDTVKSFSNISTTMLCHAVLAACLREESRVPSPEQRTGGGEVAEESRNGLVSAPSPGDSTPDLESPLSNLRSCIDRAAAYIERAGGVPALVARYGQDRTFSVPILTHCALAGLVEWRSIPPLPFELACLPARFYKTVRLPVVSYALPALIAIGQVRHHFAPTRNPLTRLLRNLAVEPSLRVLERIQPSSGGFLEATPLTSFVTMSLAAMGRVEHPVVQKGVEFLVHSVRPDGSWPIDTNLSTWVTTLAVNALGDDLPEESRLPILEWLLDQQYQTIHPYTNADPGGWAWTPLPGGVPDADDTPGALLAVMELSGSPKPSPAGAPPHPPAPAGEGAEGEAPPRDAPIRADARPQHAVEGGVRWLLGLQNRDGGFPTFCRGWGHLPFDRSSPDITAHALRAFAAHAGEWLFREDDCDELDMPASTADGLVGMHRGFRYLSRSQGTDGSWRPLWFGNQHAPDDINPTYGTAKVLAAYRDCRRLDEAPAQRGMQWLRENQNPDGGWGAGGGTPSSVEETALAVEALLDDPQAVGHVSRGLEWLMQRVEAVNEARGAPPAEQPGPLTILDPAPIGFYFAKLWYFERLYPLIFAVSCLRRAVHRLESTKREV